ncbi:MAG: putative Fe-S protein [Microbacterium sp.]|jgi:uncharacterized protein YcbX|nr:putative Fe-S protein [Microbacterium sp.]
MPTVAALYRYPVKGLTPERRDELVVQDDGRIQGDRVLAFRFADAIDPIDDGGLEAWPKSRGLALMDFPSLARLTATFRDGRLSLRADGRLLADAPLDAAGRERLEAAITSYIATTTEAGALEREGVLPLHLIGDGHTSRFQDRARGFVSLHGAASVQAVDATVPAPVDDRRFRSNIVVSGTAPWAELDWRGRVRVGEVVFEVQRPIGRCAAIMANPDTGERDARLLGVLTRQFGQDEATLGILLLPVGRGGVIRAGDEVTVD